ncbi:MAG: D-alanyl-D-alanine carboxypeptidase family protein, partial [Erysipelotrichaceae bacterium]|nr:D-alanyl-D-alanine carboxypeptidase family protein [Erysipelotrichaceae bacterium]
MHSYLKIIFKLMMILLLGVGDIYLGYKTFVKFSINKIEVEATDNDWKEEMLLLVNAEHPLMDNYYFEKYELRNGQLIDKRIYPYLKQMFDEMKELGLRAFVRSGYRDYNQQEELFKERYLNYLSNGLNEDEALVLTQKEVALPKTSE